MVGDHELLGEAADMRSPFDPGLRLVATGRVGRFGSGDDCRAKACGGGEDTVIGNQRTPRSGDQGTESFEESGG